MRITELLTESVTITVYDFDSDKKEYNFINPRNEKRECQPCDGTGKLDGNAGKYECYWCEGSGEDSEMVHDSPELNVSNFNMNVICELFGVEFDYSGCLDSDKLPEYRRRLVSISNDGLDQFTRQDTVEKGNTFVDKSKPVPEIRRGATIHTMGLSQAQIKRYVDDLTKIIDFAQKNNGTVCWG